MKMLASNIISSSNTDAVSSVVGSLERQESSSKLGFFLKSVNNSLMKPFQADPIKAISKLNDKQQTILVENVKNIVSVLMKPENLKQEGMLRVSAKKEDLIDCFENVVHKTVSLEKAVNLAENKGIFALSGCLKRIISAIPFILDKDLKEIKAALQIAGNRVPYSKIHKITDEAIKRLPQYQQNILYQAMNYFFMLGEAQEQSSRENKMTEGVHNSVSGDFIFSLYHLGDL